MIDWKRHEKEHQKTIEKLGLDMIFLITPQTTDERIREIDKASNSFIYVVSSFGTTGAKTSISYSQKKYFDKIGALALKNPQVVGFGVSNAASFHDATVHAKGAIIGSAFINILTEEGLDGIPDFIKTIR